MDVSAAAVESAQPERTAGAKWRKVRKSGPTSRVFWLTAYGLTIVAVLLRLPSLHQAVRQQVRHSDLAGTIENKNMEALAVNIGLLLAVFLSMLLQAVFYSLAAMLEQNILTMRLQDGRGRGIGLGFVIALLCTFPVHLVSSVFDISSPKTTGWYYVYILGVAAIAPIPFRRDWIDLGRRKIVTIYAFVVGLAGLSLAI